MAQALLDALPASQTAMASTVCSHRFPPEFACRGENPLHVSPARQCTLRGDDGSVGKARREAGAGGSTASSWPARDA